MNNRVPDPGFGKASNDCSDHRECESQDEQSGEEPEYEVTQECLQETAKRLFLLQCTLVTKGAESLLFANICDGLGDTSRRHRRWRSMHSR